jgi:hypothetical protein
MNRTTLLLAALVASATIPAAASAHAFLKSATPPVGSTVPTPPTQIVIDYTEGVEPAFSTVTVVNAHGARMDDGKATTAPNNNTELVVPLKPLTAGTYTVRWHVTSTDTHKTQGSYKFTVGQ